MEQQILDECHILPSDDGSSSEEERDVYEIADGGPAEEMPQVHQQNLRGISFYNKIPRYNGEANKWFSWRKEFVDLADLHEVTDYIRKGKICKARLGEVPRHFIEMKEQVLKKQMTWSKMEKELELRFAKASPEKLFDAMYVKQEPKQKRRSQEG